MFDARHPRYIPGTYLNESAVEITVSNMCEISLSTVQETLLVFQDVLKSILHVSGNLEEIVMKVRTSNLRLDEELSNLERAELMGVSFTSHFEFALVSVLLRGLQVSSCRELVIELLDLLHASTRRTTHGITGYAAALLPIRRDILQLSRPIQSDSGERISVCNTNRLTAASLTTLESQGPAEHSRSITGFGSGRPASIRVASSSSFMTVNRGPLHAATAQIQPRSSAGSIAGVPEQVLEKVLNKAVSDVLSEGTTAQELDAAQRDKLLWPITPIFFGVHVRRTVCMVGCLVSQL
jgi:hypothetical protein